MSNQDVTWLIGGPQGSGINVSAESFARAIVRGGLRVFANIEYHSNIMGEHSYYRVRVSEQERHSILDRVNLVVALDDETLVGEPHVKFTGHHGHLDELAPGGAVVYDSAMKLDVAKVARNDVKLYPVPYQEILRQTLKEFDKEDQLSRLRVMMNTIAVGASLAVLDYDVSLFGDVMREGFKGRRREIGEMNARAAALGFAYVQQNFADGFAYHVQKKPSANGQQARPMLIRGMHACAFGKIKAGLAIQTYYPISPATDESVYLESQQRNYDLVVVQTEDEIAAINMAVGAAHAGVRVATSTSGPGASLMIEGIGFASITEAPGPVLFLWQRGGPSTGLPTRQEQGDLRFAMQLAHGESPHIVVAPADPQEIFDDSFESFNWADRYQMPVVVIVDKYLSTSHWTLDELKMSGLKIDRGALWHQNGNAEKYLRYAFTEDGISPRALPGQEGGIFWSTTDEHDPEGHITEDATNRIKMMEKRMGKLGLAAREIPTERKLQLHGPDDADVTVVGWGSTKGSILDALAELDGKDGLRWNYLQIRLLRPFPSEEVAEILRRARRTVLVENNYTCQLGNLIREMTGISLDHEVPKYDGRPFSQEELIEALEKVLASGERRVFVSHLSA
ncbi:MAG TPA: 2-oxoacid:acceptor oxidoreductase subunit alpha [Chloroflexota bacterium]|nr:2-oxoacid:acceptor oxidoreductase subunit alpha [Chloroflexota bacterium]